MQHTHLAFGKFEFRSEVYILFWLKELVQSVYVFFILADSDSSAVALNSSS